MTFIEKIDDGQTSEFKKNELDSIVKSESKNNQHSILNCLSDSENLFEDVFDSLGDGLCIMDTNLNVIKLNKIAENVTKTDSNPIGKKCYEIFIKQNTPCNNCPALKTLETGKTSKEIFSLYEFLGLNIWLELITFPLKNCKGEIVGIIESFRDITKTVETDNELNESFHLMSSIIESSPDHMIFSLDRDFNYTAFNTSHYQLMKRLFNVKIHKNSPILGFIDNPCLKEKMIRLFNKAGKGDYITDLIELFDGNEKLYIESHLSPIFNDERSINGITILQTDISDRIRTERELGLYREKLEQLVEERTDELRFTNEKLKKEIEDRKILHDILRKSSELNKALFEGTLEPIAIMDLNDKVITFNQAFGKTFGYEIHELAGKDFPGHFGIDDGKFEEWLETCKNGRGISDYETIRKTKNGNIIDVSITISPIKNKSGELESLSFMYRDITKRKDAERAVLASETRYKDLINSSLVGIYITQKHILKFCNKKLAEIFGYANPEELIGTHVSRLVHPDTWHKVDREVSLRESGEKEMSNYDFIGLKKDGSQIDIEVFGRALNINNEFVIQGTLIDISLKKQAERSLKELNASKDKFFSIIAHDLKAPISGFLNLTDMLLQDFGELTLSEIQQMSQSLNISAAQLYKLLENLLDWSRSQTNSLQCNPALNDLHDLAINNIFLLQDNALEKHINISSDIKPGTLAYFDHDMINTVFRNLLSNALKFTHKGGNVEIYAERSGPWMIVSVSDTGIGLSQNKLDNLFKIDVHQISFGTNNERGTGLGLILCQEFIKKHGGTIKVNSSDSIGSVFSFTLPISQEYWTAGE